MVYLVGAETPDRPAGLRFQEMLDAPGILRLPGAHNGQAALQAKAAGFEALYLSGAAMTASMGLPDLGIITVDGAAWAGSGPGSVARTCSPPTVTSQTSRVDGPIASG